MAKKYNGIGDILSGKDSANEENNGKKVDKVEEAPEKEIITTHRIKASLHKRMKIAAIEEGVAERFIVAKALEQYLDGLKR